MLTLALPTRTDILRPWLLIRTETPIVRKDKCVRKSIHFNFYFLIAQTAKAERKAEKAARKAAKEAHRAKRKNNSDMNEIDQVRAELNEARRTF